ncbi:MAG TPA: beta-propeller fold lactonase family protein [Thermoanaerobaculia bacterium]|jgi:6-phosphogluconolactonase (cycloisomerase 2 family)
MNRKAIRRGLVRLTAAAVIAFAAVSALAQGGDVSISKRAVDGFVYVMTNAASGNSVIQFGRSVNGRLTKVHEESTQGLGSGGMLDPLTSQNSLVLGAGGRFLLAVNAGSDELSLLRASRNGLRFVNKVASGGDFPNSVAHFEGLVYVLNRDSANIAGFRVCLPGGTFEPIANSVVALPGGAGSAPADIRFSPDGAWLAVTQTAANQIVLFPIDADGAPGTPVVTPAEGVGAFGFAFRADGTLIVTEAMSASASSYSVASDGTLDAISAAVPDGQAATCWVSLTPGGDVAFVSNTAAANLSSYAVGADGELTLEEDVTGALPAGSAPIDSAMSRDGRYLYVIDSVNGRVIVYNVHGAKLTKVDAVTGLPVSIQGIAAR